MSVIARIEHYIDSQPPVRHASLRALHQTLLRLAPDCPLCFLDGRDSDGKRVTNENIGYGTQTLNYADGSTREFYRIGLSANTGGVSVYIMGLTDRKFLQNNYAARLGKAKITGYCIKFRKLADIDLAVLAEIFAQHLGVASPAN